MDGKMRFGCIPSGRVRQINLKAEDATTDLNPVDWNAVIIPSDYQNEGSCVARATMNLAECLIRLRDGINAFKPGEQLDAESCYWMARKRFYNDQEDEGLQLKMGLQVAIEDMGIFPPDTEIAEIEPTLPSIVSTLQKIPMVQAMLIGSAWRYPSPVNGEIRYQQVSPAYSLGGHATLMTSYLKKGDVDYLGLQNTWQNWGWHSQGLLSWDAWWACYRWMLDGPYTVKLNPDSWKNWTGFNKWIIRP